MTLVLGTSGWAYPEWRPDFYPPGLPRDGFLAHYASVLGGCEVNATSYRLQSRAAVARWAAQVPPGFRFTAKAHRRLTEGAHLPPDGGGDVFFVRFLASLEPLGPRLGAILLQLPETRARDDRALAGLMACLPPALPFAVEFRDGSWDHPEVAEAVAAAGGTVCLTDTSGTPPAALPPGRIAYVRLRAERYSRATRAAWLDLLRAEAERRTVYAFARHEDLPAGDPLAGVGMAAWMAARLRAGD
jgi:uncharacterized protein YecE (DUF72 family)